MAAKKSKAKIEEPVVESFESLELVEVDLEQGSAEWLEWRRRYRMASESAAIMGVSPYQTAADVRRAKLSGVGQTQNAAMRRGQEQEPIARAAYEALFGEVMLPSVIQRGEYAASLDGWSADRRVVLEIKTPWQGRENERWKAAEASTVRADDAVQIQHQLMVSGAQIGHLWVWDHATQEGLLVCVLPDCEMQEKIRAAWDEFWPSMTERDDIEWVAAAEAWKLAKQSSDAAEADLEIAVERIKKLAVGKFTCGGGVTVTRNARVGNVNWTQVRADFLPNVSDETLEKYRGKASETVTIKEVKQ